MLNLKVRKYKKNLDQNINVWRNAVILVRENWEVQNKTRFTSKTSTLGVDFACLVLWVSQYLSNRLVNVPPLFVGVLLTK